MHARLTKEGKQKHNQFDCLFQLIVISFEKSTGETIIIEIIHVNM